MNDLERIKKIEEVLGVPFQQVEVKESGIVFDKNTYTLNEDRSVIRITFASSTVNLINTELLADFQKLTELYFLNDGLADYSILKELKALESLRLANRASNKTLANLSSLKELRNLKNLIIANVILSDTSFLKEMKGLRVLTLGMNNLSETPFLKDLLNLTHLLIIDNRLTNLPLLRGLVNLTQLVLAENKISDASALKDLANLEILDLSSNQLTDISFIKELEELQYLNLVANSIKVLPEFITENKMEITLDKTKNEVGYLVLADNPIIVPPLYVVQHGKAAIKKYFEKGEPYLDSFQIKNYFCLESISVVNLADKKEIYFLGENGDGKTILLQAIALALKGDQKFGIVSDVLKDNLSFINEQNENTIEHKQNNSDLFNENIRKKIKFNSPEAESPKARENEINPIPTSFEATDSFGYKKQYIEGNTEFPHLNVYAYGINRVFNRNDDTREDENKEVYLSLFDHRYGLTDPVQWLKDIRLLTLENKEKGLPEPIVTVSLAQQLLSELLSKEIEIKISGTSVTFSEKGSAPVSFRQLSDGYKSVINWLCDLLSRLSQNQPHVKKLEDYYGIVLVDEIGVYLHPRLQFTLVRMLRDKFKKIQWIFTTHSPIITLGASEDAVFYKLYKESGKTQIAGPVNGIAGMTANSLITSVLWRLDEFTTQGTDINQINSDDYIYKVIHDTIRERIKKNINLTDKDTAQMVQKLLDNLKTLESKITQDWESDVSSANQLLDA